MVKTHGISLAAAGMLAVASYSCATDASGQDSLHSIDSLALRVTEGTSAGKIFFSQTTDSDSDYYRIIPSGDKVLIEGNSPVSQAAGLHRYLRDVAGIHICWNNLTQTLPETIPLPADTISATASTPYRYYMNYCTFSYSTPFWDEDRWEKEIDWMALHGINLPLAITGTEAVWQNVLRRLGYTQAEIDSFIAPPPYTAWWLMNNLEAQGGPASQATIESQLRLQKKILARMRSLGMKPVLPGYSGMLPHNAASKLNVATSDPGLWCGYPRPSFLSPDSEDFARIADIYYEELTKLYGKATHYSADPFHEGGKTDGVDMRKAGESILSAMRRASDSAVWVIQAWQDNPRAQMIDSLPRNSLLILDLYAERKPQWGDSVSVWHRPEGFGAHDWIYCMLLNFGGNVGMHGSSDKLISGYRSALSQSKTLRGIGATPEGIENNPVMFELLFDLPWRDIKDINSYTGEYLKTRYNIKGALPKDLTDAWQILTSTVYNKPRLYAGEGTVESIVCARPSWDIKGASTWGNANLFYDPHLTQRACSLYMKASTEVLLANRNFVYDLAEIRRQAISDRVYQRYNEAKRYMQSGDRERASKTADSILSDILLLDSVVASSPGFSTDKWLDAAYRSAQNEQDAIRNVRNAARLITVWGDNPDATNKYGLKDYSHRLWHGITSGLYYKRWKAFFEHEFRGAPVPDYYRMELQWVDEATADCMAKHCRSGSDVEE